MTNEAIETATPEEGYPDTGHVPAKEYSSTGQTVLATRRGYRFAHTNKDIPVIDSEGVAMSDAEAAVILEEADKAEVHVFKVEANKEGE